jgi:hypothetical protein
VSAVSLPADGIAKAAFILAALLALPMRAEAQVGLASRPSQVALIARVPAGASLQADSPRLLGNEGSVRTAKVSVRLISTSGYRLLVHGTAHQGDTRSDRSGRIWVQGVDGLFHELQENSPVTVARDRNRAGEFQQEVVFHLENSGPAAEMTSLPVRYEIVVNPIL